jgi:hypothetical protein
MTGILTNTEMMTQVISSLFQIYQTSRPSNYQRPNWQIEFEHPSLQTLLYFMTKYFQYKDEYK